MTGQLLELIIFAGIAIFVISKLLSILGTTSDDEIGQKKSFFGEPTGRRTKEVKSAAINITKDNIRRSLTKKIGLKGHIVSENKDDIIKGIKEIEERLPNFTVEKFLNSSKAAFTMIIDNANKNNEEELEELVDKRYLHHFIEIAPSYGEFNEDSKNIKALISEIYMFGNNAFVKVLFVGDNITSKIKHMHEEWTFSKSTIADGPAWYLTNIDRPQ